MECIAYEAGYKYQLHGSYVVQIDIKPKDNIPTEYIQLTKDGMLTIKEGYAWDGPSGPTIDTLNFMRGSLVHDALYQLMRGRYLDEDTYRDASDETLQKLCKEDGMSFVRAWWVYWGVRLFGKPSADPSNDKQLVKAPKGCQ